MKMPTDTRVFMLSFISMLSQTSRNSAFESGVRLRCWIKYSVGMVGNLETKGRKF
jgi:hypothetical protein